MRFTPKTENELASAGLLAAGEYDFEIIKAEDTTSKSSGNEMIALLLKVFSPDGESRLVNDYLMATEKAMYKLRHAAEACGILDKFDEGSLEASDFYQRSGRCKIAIQKDKTEQYPDKNTVKDYVAANGAAASSPARTRQPAMAQPEIDDEIPF